MVRHRGFSKNKVSRYDQNMTRSRLYILIFSIFFHIFIYFLIQTIYRNELLVVNETIDRKRMYVHLQKNKEDREVVEKDESIEEIKDKGQIIEQFAKEKEMPKDAKFLSEDRNRTEKEEQIREKNINPELLGEQNFDQEIVQFEEAIDVKAEESSSGATAGVEKPAQENNGPLISIPSQYQYTNKKGIASPTVASSLQQKQQGKISNDLLVDVEYGNRQSVNAHEYKYASYMNQIRRLVNFYWQQNLNNLSLSIPTDSYTTSLIVIINKDGGIHEITIHQSCGIEDLDQAIYSAFYLAAPFPAPPELLVENDKVLLPYFSFTLDLHASRPEYSGIDPRAGVRYPGLLKNSDQ